MTNKKFNADKEIVLAAVKNDGLALEYACEELRADREIVLTAVKNDSLALRFACEKFKSDREIVLAAVKKNGYALEYASNKLKTDKEVVFVAIKDGWASLEYASDELKTDKNFVLEAIKHSEYSFEILEYASAELKADKDVVLAAVKKDGSNFRYASDALRADREIILEAVKKDGSALQYAIEKMKPTKIKVSRYNWQVPSTGNMFSGYLEGSPSDEEIRKCTEETLKARAEWKPSKQAMELFEQLKIFIGYRVKIQFGSPFMFYDEDDRPSPLEADCKDVVILNVDLRGDVFPQAYLVIDNMSEAASRYNLTSRERIVDPLADNIVGDFVSISQICELWVE